MSSARKVPAKSRKLLRKPKKKVFVPSATGDNDDHHPHVIANQLRALRRDMSAGFDLLGNKLLVTMERMDHRQDAFADELADLRRRILDLEAKTR